MGSHQNKEYFATQIKCCFLQRKYCVLSYLLRQRLIPRLTCVCKAVLGLVGHLLQCSVDLRYICVLPLHFLLPNAECSVSPMGLLATHKLAAGRSGAHQLFWATERRKTINSKWVMKWSGFWVLKRTCTEMVKRRKLPKVLKIIFSFYPYQGVMMFPNSQWSKQVSHIYLCMN